MKKAFRTFLTVFVLILVIVSCNKQNFLTDSNVSLNFSTDTVMFDTVFSTFGSTTKQLRVYNHYNQPVKITSIRLGKGNSTGFRLNIDGITGNEARDIEIPPKDSLYIFVEVTVNPTGQNQPMVIQDSIIFNTNGKEQDVDLVAYGQDVHLFRKAIIGSQTWTADKPYLIYDYLAVDSLETLTIEAGTQIYLHKKALFLVAGTLHVNGEKDNEVIFQGDRLEDLYKELPGQWGLLAFTPGSHDNSMNHTIIKNGTLGMQIGLYDDFHYPDLKITNSTIKNISAIGIYAFGAQIEAENLVIANCGSYALSIWRGGSYSFTHCTIGNYWSAFTNRSDPSLVISNYVYIQNPETKENERWEDNLTSAYFGNSIIYGNLANEVEIASRNTSQMNYLFDHCLLRVNTDSTSVEDTVHFNDIIINKDPRFIKPVANYEEPVNLQLDTLSPAKDTGSIQIGSTVPYDYNGNSRLQDKAPDLGAYERIDSTEITR